MAELVEAAVGAARGDRARVAAGLAAGQGGPVEAVGAGDAGVGPLLGAVGDDLGDRVGGLLGRDQLARGQLVVDVGQRPHLVDDADRAGADDPGLAGVHAGVGPADHVEGDRLVLGDPAAVDPGDVQDQAVGDAQRSPGIESLSCLRSGTFISRSRSPTWTALVTYRRSLPPSSSEMVLRVRTSREKPFMRDLAGPVGRHLDAGSAYAELRERLVDRQRRDPDVALDAVDADRHLPAAAHHDGRARRVTLVSFAGASRSCGTDLEVRVLEHACHRPRVRADLLPVTVDRDEHGTGGRGVGGVAADHRHDEQAERYRAQGEGADAHRTPNVDLPGHGRAASARACRQTRSWLPPWTSPTPAVRATSPSSGGWVLAANVTEW